MCNAFTTTENVPGFTIERTLGYVGGVAHDGRTALENLGLNAKRKGATIVLGVKLAGNGYLVHGTAAVLSPDGPPLPRLGRRAS